MEAEIILRELQFKAVRSSGPGGQHVNKTSSKVELVFDLFSSEGLTASEKETLKARLSNRISTQGLLILQSGESRSQHRNKRLVIERLMSLLKENLKQQKPRIKSKPSKASIEKRLQQKKRQAQKKSLRKPPPEA